MTAHSTIHITEEHVGTRLDQFLVATLSPEVSRSRVQKAIQAKQVLINDKPATKHQFLRLGDVISMTQEIAAPTKPDHVLISPDYDLSVLFEDDAIIVVNKPTDLIVHPGNENDDQPSVSGWFVKHMGSDVIDLAWESAFRPGIVHRLDKFVTGVMVLAKTPEVLENLKKQFQERTVEKEYRAVVYGVLPQEAGDIRFALHRSSMNPGKMAARPEHAEGRDAWTEYAVLQNINDRYSVLKVQIHTGRTHQIRAHLAAIDHPVVGDRLYISKKYPVFQKSDALFLHSERLAFAHPTTGESLSIIAPLPEHFALFSAE